MNEAAAPYGAFLDQAPIPIIVFSAPDLVMRYINRAAIEALGISDEPSYVGLPFVMMRQRQTWRHFDSQGAVISTEDVILIPVMRGETVQESEFITQRKDGSRRWFLVRATVLPGPDGTPAYVIIVFPDITQRKLDTDALKYRRDLEHLINGISTRFVNCAAEESDAAIQDALAAVGSFTTADRCYLFFFRPRERKMDNTHEWCAPGITPQKGNLQDRDVDEYGSFYKPILGSQTITIPRVSAMEPSDVRAELERQEIQSLLCVPIALRRRVVGFMGLDAVRREATWAPDVDSLLRIVGELCANALAHKRTDEALRLSEERYRLVSDLGSHLLYDYSVPTGAIEWRGKIKELTGYEPAELNSQGVAGWEEMIHPEDRQEAAQRLQESMRAHALYHAEYRFRRKDGSYMPVDDRGSFFYGQDGAAARMVGSMRDMTERSILQGQLQQAMKMEAVGRLAGGVAHDFNNLLTTIMGNIDMARSIGGGTEDLRQCLGEIEKAAESATALTRQLLAFSRRQIIEPQPLDLNGLVTRMELMLRRLIGEDVALQTTLAHGLGVIKADPGQVEQALVNLAVNARDAMPDGGRLLIETGNVELDAAACRAHAGLRPGPYVRLSVSDTGHGMSDEVKSHLFEPFFTTKPKGRGTGLGLATIFGIVKQAGGAMEVFSEPGRGTTFRIHLPRVEAPAAASPTRAADRLGTGSETILLVEDEEGVRNLARAVLGRCGYTVLAASDGEEAMRMAAASTDPIHLLLTDVVMPGLNGRELASRLTALRPRMKVLYSSGYTEDTEVLRGVVDAQLYFIAKPYTPRTLAAKIREVLEAGAR